jgi:sarcosine oxidase
VRANLPGLADSSPTCETCLYASTPDDDFVVDRSGPIILGFGFGGHGFKFGAIIGEMLAQLVQGASPHVSPRFSRSRFAPRGSGTIV